MSVKAVMLAVLLASVLVAHGESNTIKPTKSTLSLIPAA
jgi:hypothetical protein